MIDKAKFVLNRKMVFDKLDELSKLADIVSYSFKTNYEVGKVLEGKCWISVHSLNSLELLKYMDKVLYFAQAWDSNELNVLFEKGVRFFVVDNKKDLDVLLDFLKDKTERISLFLRMRLKENTIHTGKHFVFGFYSNQVNEVIPKLKNNKNIQALGIHFHRKTQNVSEWSLKEELKDSLNDEVFKIIKFVNIGGGLPSVYKNYREGIIDSIFAKIEDLREFLNYRNIKMIIEPGRYIAAPAVKLVTKVRNIYGDNVIVNCSAYNSAMDTFIANIRLLVENESEKGYCYTIKGSTPDSLDIFRYKVFLKNKLKKGDKIVFLNAGAYNFHTDFCNLPHLETEIVD